MSRTYWKDREAENLKRNKLSEKKYKAEVESIYAKMLDSIESEINAFYGKYAAKEDITIAEAKKRVSKLDIEAYERKAKKYVKDKNLSKQANEEMRLYNLTMKINRLEMLKSRIGLELISGFDDLEKFMADILKGRTQDELERQAGILGDSVTESANFGKKVDSIVNASFHNATFSQRIWAHQDLLKLELDKQLKQGLIQGKGARDLARNIRDACNASMRNAERLMITELARVQIEAQKLSYKENGFEMYEFISEATACPICKELDGKHFEVGKMMPGENAAPMHPYCRCSTAPYEDRKTYDEWLGAKKDGTFDGTLEEWRKTHLTSDEEGAIRRYISSESYKINELLRGGKRLTLDEQLFIRDLDSALKKMPRYSGTVYRSMSSTFMRDYESFQKAYREGKSIRCPDYISTGTSVYDESMDVQIIIECKKGRDLRTYNPEEAEILYERGAGFYVTRKEGNRIWLVEN